MALVVYEINCRKCIVYEWIDLRDFVPPTKHRRNFIFFFCLDCRLADVAR